MPGKWPEPQEQTRRKVNDDLQPKITEATPDSQRFYHFLPKAEGKTNIRRNPWIYNTERLTGFLLRLQGRLSRLLDKNLGLTLKRSPLCPSNLPISCQCNSRLHQGLLGAEKGSGLCPPAWGKHRWNTEKHPSPHSLRHPDT